MHIFAFNKKQFSFLTVLYFLHTNINTYQHNIVHSWNSPPLQRRGGIWTFKIFLKWGDSDFTHKKEWLLKKVVSRKVGTLSLICIIGSPFQPCTYLSEHWCLFCMFTPYLSEFFMFRMKKLILFNVINWHVTSTSQWFLSGKDIVELCKVNSRYHQILHWS